MAGFQNASSYREFMTFVLCHTPQNMSYWTRNLHGNLPDAHENSTQTANVSTGHTNKALSKEDRIFLTLARLRLGLPLHYIANLFIISIATFQEYSVDSFPTHGFEKLSCIQCCGSIFAPLGTCYC